MNRERLSSRLTLAASVERPYHARVPRYGKDTKVYCGQGANVARLSDPDMPVMGNINISNSATIQQLMLAGNALSQTYAIRSEIGVNFDRIIMEGVDAVDGLAEWLTHLSSTKPGENLVVVLGNRCVWLRGLLRGSVNLSMPFDDLASISGAPGAEEYWGGTVSALSTVDNNSPLPTETGHAITYQIANGEGGIAVLTDLRAGSTDLLFQSKRGSGAWTPMDREAHGISVPSVTNSGSAVELDVSDLRAGDQVRVTYNNAVTQGNRWTGRLAACTPVDLG